MTDFPTARLFALRVFCVCTVTAAATCQYSSAETEKSLANAWKTASLTLVNESNAEFRELLAKDTPDRRQLRFGEAATLINVQPKTAANLDNAVAVFQDLAEEDPNDDIAVYSRYLIGRVAQIHRLDADLELAANTYRELLRDHPQNKFAQRAVPKLAVIELFDPLRSPDDQTGALEIEAFAANLTDPLAIRDTALMLADYYTMIAPNDTKALENLLIANEQGIQRYKFRATVLVRIAELSRRTGNPDQAVDYYQMFLDEFQRDQRRTLIEERIEELTQAAPVAE